MNTYKYLWIICFLRKTILKNYTEIFGEYVVSAYEADGREVNGYTEKLETTIREFWKENNNSLFVRFG